ncbi:hypothetical protein BHM03_00046773 [Ensete ventricosum]|nr:hypothetical protein BHM03_00046773 [Ensete ventricosum]
MRKRYATKGLQRSTCTVANLSSSLSLMQGIARVRDKGFVTRRMDGGGCEREAEGEILKMEMSCTSLNTVLA